MYIKKKKKSKTNQLVSIYILLHLPAIYLLNACVWMFPTKTKATISQKFWQNKSPHKCHIAYTFITLEFIHIFLIVQNLLQILDLEGGSEHLVFKELSICEHKTEAHATNKCGKHSDHQNMTINIMIKSQQRLTLEQNRW